MIYGLDRSGWLQWVRELSSTVRLDQPWRPRAKKELQWVRELSSTVSDLTSLSPLKATLRFNGSVNFHPR